MKGKSTNLSKLQMTKINEVVGIQFIKGKNEKDLPEIRLYRSPDGKKGQAVYKFFKPITITIDNIDFADLFSVLLTRLR